MKASLPTLVARKMEAAGNFFIPEKLTPLAFTPVYHELTVQERTRYNQLSGLYLLEQTIFFEQYMGRPVLECIERRGPVELRKIARSFIDEENSHTSWFYELLRACEPGWYERDPFRFIRTGRFASMALDFATHHPRLFPCLLWLQILAEERAQQISGAFLVESSSLDARFVEVQRKHLADEGDHIRWDVELIEWLWLASGAFVRKTNAMLLRWLLAEFFYLPKRSGWNVVEQFLREHPHLSLREMEFRKAMEGLAKTPEYLRTLYPASFFPRTRRLAKRWSEMHFLDSFFPVNPHDPISISNPCTIKPGNSCASGRSIDGSLKVLGSCLQLVAVACGGGLRIGDEFRVCHAS